MGGGGGWDSAVVAARAACAGLLIILEQFGKVLTKRPRPTYHAKNAEQKVWVYHGEWWSMPSGHTLRAAYLAHYLAVGTIAPPRLLSLRAGGNVFPAAPLLVWAALVGWSRVAKGRHYPGDCVVGWLLGHGLGLYLKGYAAPRFRCMSKIIGGFLFVPQVTSPLTSPLISPLISSVTSPGGRAAGRPGDRPRARAARAHARRADVRPNRATTGGRPKRPS